MKDYPPKSPGTNMPFGKHKGKTIEEVIREDPRYVKWCLKKVEGFNLDTRAWVMLDKALADAPADTPPWKKLKVR